MPKKSPLEDQLALLRHLRQSPPDQPAIAALKQLLETPRTHGMAIKAAAELALKWDAKDLTPSLRLAAEGLSPITPEGPKRDPGCEGKEAVLRTLIQWEADLPHFFLTASTWVQLQPLPKGAIDTAAECRGLAAIGIAHTRATREDDDTLSILLDLLADKEAATRLRTAQALGIWRGPESIPLLRLKALLGDDNPDVLAEIFVALLHQNPRTQVSFVARFLSDENPRILEAAAVALGESRRPEALPHLIKSWDTLQRDPVHTSLLMAIALLRQEESVDWLLPQLATTRAATATEILDALAIYKGDDRIVARIQAAAATRTDLTKVLHELFG